MSVIGLLHPGSMGAAVGAALRAAGHDVLYASEGRSRATTGRAAGAGLTDAGTLAELVARSQVVLSVCPPDAAVEVANAVVHAPAPSPQSPPSTAPPPSTGTTQHTRTTQHTGTAPTPEAGPSTVDGRDADAGFRGTYVDANAVSPATARRICAVIEDAGGRFVDGGIIGGPPGPARPGETRLYLSGGGAGEVAALFGGSPLDARALDGGAVAASALKMCYAAWTKGTAALLLAIAGTAREEGVGEALLAEWATSQPGLAERGRRAQEAASGKGWRWSGEMEEIAATFAAANQPGGFHEAAAEVFRRYPRP